jgi:hypothetical protein
MKIIIINDYIFYYKKALASSKTFSNNFYDFYYSIVGNNENLIFNKLMSVHAMDINKINAIGYILGHYEFMTDVEGFNKFKGIDGKNDLTVLYGKLNVYQNIVGDKKQISINKILVFNDSNILYKKNINYKGYYKGMALDILRSQKLKKLY